MLQTIVQLGTAIDGDGMASSALDAGEKLRHAHSPLREMKMDTEGILTNRYAMECDLRHALTDCGEDAARENEHLLF